MTKNDKRDPFRIDRRAASRLADLGDKAKGHCQRLDDVGRALGFRDGKTMMSLLKSEEGRAAPCGEIEARTPLLDAAARILSGTDDIFLLREGQKTPSPEQMRLLVSVVGIILSQHGLPITPATTGLIRACLDWAYGPQGPAQRSVYHENDVPAVDEALRRAGGRLPEDATWAQVAVLLRLYGDHHAAYAAQRASTPRLVHLHNATSSVSISTVYRDVAIESGEPLLNAFSRAISEVVRGDYVAPQGNRVLALERDGSRTVDIRAWMRDEPVERVVSVLLNDPDWATTAAFYVSDEDVPMSADGRAAALWLIEHRDLAGVAQADQKRLAALAMSA